MDYAELAPPPALATVVRCVWTLRGEHRGPGAAAASPAYPDGSPELIFNFGEPFQEVRADGTATAQPLAFLVGQITGPMVVRPTGAIDLIAVRFEAHAASVLRRPMQTLTDRWSSLADLGTPAADRLMSAYAEARAVANGEARVACLMAALAEVVAPPSSTESLVAEAVRAIRESGGVVRLEDLAGRLGWTTRTLQRHFVDHVGITPKLLARVVRFQRVFVAVQYEPSALSQVAQECGYFDQSHLVRDFQDFAGEAPARALTQMPEFTAFFTALRASV